MVDLAVTRIMVVGYQLVHLFRFWILPSLRQKASLPDELYDPLPVIHALSRRSTGSYLPSTEQVVAILLDHGGRIERTHRGSAGMLPALLRPAGKMDHREPYITDFASHHSRSVTTLWLPGENVSRRAP